MTYQDAREVYAGWGIDTEAAIAKALEIPISIHCWQADDVGGFEVKNGVTDGGGIMATGNYPGKARGGDEVRQDIERVLSLVPGVHRFNLHAIYAETEGKAVGRDALEPEHFARWIDWAKGTGICLDYNPTYFGHPMAASGFTLSDANDDVRAFWVRHGISSRRVAAGMGQAQGTECINNHWCPDGAKDQPADRWSPRARLADSYDQIFASGDFPGCTDAVESKLFGLGSEDYVVGSFEFYSHYALRNDLMFCLDMGHFHPTESVADKISALLQFHSRLLIHTSRPMRWDSDHVVILDDPTRNLFLEIARGNAWDRVVIALDFFDASINRIAAYVTGIRSTRKAILTGLLDPTKELQAVELAGNGGRKLALMEEAKTLPFGEVWNELCTRAEVPAGRAWIDEVDAYATKVLSQR